jgi:Protein of unknown function (DUF3102)
MNEVTPSSLTSTPEEIALTEHAAAIRACGKRMIGEAVEIGRRLTDCQRRLRGDGQWLAWLEREFKWSDRTAHNFMQLHNLIVEREKISDLTIPLSGLYLLAAPEGALSRWRRKSAVGLQLLKF